MDSQISLTPCRRAAVVCGAILSGSVMLVIVVEILKNQLQGAAPVSGMGTNLVYIFYGITFAQIMAIQVLRMAMGKKEGLNDDQWQLQQLKRAIVTAAVGESIVFLGLVLFIIARKYQEFYIFLAISVAVQVFYFPRSSQWEETAK